MAALPQIKRLMLEEFKDQKKWVGPLLQTLNTFMEEVVAAFTTALTLAANTTSDVKTVVLSSVPTPTTPVSIAWSKATPVAVVVGNAVRTSGAAFTLATAIQVQWVMKAGSLQITNVVGITPTGAAQYELTLICIAG